MHPSPAAAALITALQLEPLPHEGGYFRQTWRTEAASAILFLMTPTEFSALHRIPQPEVWHFLGGDPVEHVRLEQGTAEAVVRRLGPKVLAGEALQLVMPGGAWQGARLDPGVQGGLGYALIGCVLAPPWDQARFELGRAAELGREFPAAAEWIRRLTR